MRLNRYAFAAGAGVCILTGAAWIVTSKRERPVASPSISKEAVTSAGAADVPVAARAGLEAEATRTAAAAVRQLADAVPIDEASVRTSILGALDALLNRSMTPQINLADARGYAAQRPSGIVDTMRRYHRTEGYFKDRPAPYDRLSPDEWVRFINQASYEDLVNLYAATGPVVARIDWADARVLTRSADEPWIYSQQAVTDLLTARGVKSNNQSVGGGRSYYAPPNMTLVSFDARTRPTVHLIIPTTTDSGEPLVCAYEFVVNERGGLDPFQLLRGQRVRDDQGELVPLLMPPF